MLREYVSTQLPRNLISPNSDGVPRQILVIIASPPKHSLLTRGSWHPRLLLPVVVSRESRNAPHLHRCKVSNSTLHASCGECSLLKITRIASCQATLQGLGTAVDEAWWLPPQLSSCTARSGAVLPSLIGFAETRSA